MFNRITQKTVRFFGGEVQNIKKLLTNGVVLVDAEHQVLVELNVGLLDLSSAAIGDGGSTIIII